MNVYDFDGTVRRGDTTKDFYLFVGRRHPSVFLGLPRAGWQYLRYRRGKITLTEFKSAFFSFLPKIPALEEEIARFVQKNENSIDAWYLAQTDPSDVIITASPEWLVAPLCRRLGVTVIGTDVDKTTGKIRGENCKGAHKTVLFAERCGRSALEQVDCFYSDSLSDTPLAKLAKEAFLVSKDCTARPWTF